MWNQSILTKTSTYYPFMATDKVLAETLLEIHEALQLLYIGILVQDSWMLIIQYVYIAVFANICCRVFLL